MHDPALREQLEASARDSLATLGVGEAAFQCIVPPYVEDFAPPGAKTLWLGVFFTAIPTGTALGFVYGAAVASSACCMRLVRATGACWLASMRLGCS